MRGEVTRSVESATGGAPFGVRARWVSVWELAQRFANFGEQRRRTGVVEIDAASRGLGQVAE
jgi:hypothetical protein